MIRRTTALRLLAASAAAIAALLVPTAAQAGIGTGSTTLYKGPSPGYGYAVWDTTPNTLQNDAWPAALASGYCTDFWFDWSRAGNHYDARVSRSCYAGVRRTSSNNVEPYEVGVMQKAGTCYGPNNATTSPLSQCNQDPRRDYDLASNSVIPGTCHRSWLLTSGAVYLYYDGGNQTSCTS